MEDRDIGRLIGVVLAAGLLWWASTWVVANWARISGTSRSLWASWWWLLALVAGMLLMLLMVRGWARRRRRGREKQRASLAAQLATVMPGDWDPGTGLSIRRWRGTSPRAVDIQVPLWTDVDDADWRSTVDRLLVSRIGPAEIEWPGNDHRSRSRQRWIRVVSQPDDSSAEPRKPPVSPQTGPDEDNSEGT